MPIAKKATYTTKLRIAMMPVYFSPIRSVSWNDNPNNANPIVNPTKLYVERKRDCHIRYG